MGSVTEAELPKIEKMQMPSAREEKILVLVRLRPLNDKEIAADEVSDWECINESTILYRNTLREGSTFPSAYSFDRVFRGDSATREVYDGGAKEVALSVVNGINSSIFAYGQTSSGKTYTMMGITEYTVADIFDYIHKHEERAFVLKFSAIEIYNEAIRDLLSTDCTPLRLLDDPEKGTIVEKVTEEVLKDWNHLKELLLVCEAQRRIGETSLNEKSSRSHQILRLTIESSAREFLGKENSTTLAATVNFVDLAGSERASQALSTGARLKEGCHINRSLLTLGTVIRKLSKGRHGHINFRDSKLTRLLQPALGGNARTAIICTLSPARSHVEQTRNTLLFACCAKEVTTKAQVNVVMSDKALVKHLQKELARLESELRSPAPASATADYGALLRKKDLQIQKMEKEIRELTKQRDLAESRIKDLLQMIGQEQTSRNGFVKSHHPSQQANDTWEDECSVSESSGVADYCSLYGDDRKFNMKRKGESYKLQDNSEHSGSDGTSSLMSVGKRSVRSNSFQNLEDTAVGPAEDGDDYCREVQCIEMNEKRQENHFEPNEGTMASTMIGDGTAAGQVISTPANGHEEVNQLQNGFTYHMLEQQLHHVRRTIEASVSPDPDETSSEPLEAMSSSSTIKLRRTWSHRENLEGTPPSIFEKKFTGRPESVRRIFPQLNYDDNAARLSRNDSQSSLGSIACTEDFESQSIKASAEEDIPSIQDFVEGLKEMAKQGYEKPIVDGQDGEMEAAAASENGNRAKDVGLDPMCEAVESSSDWLLAFERQQREILELWQICNVSLVHRTYFYLLFKGDDSTDSIYMEVELRRLSFLKQTFSQDSIASRKFTFASSLKALRRERVMLSKLMQRRLTEEERKKIYHKWGIGFNSKRRRLQLANLLWTNTNDMNHISDSAAIVAKLVRFVEHGQALKEMFGLSFAPTPATTRRRSLGWTHTT